MSYDLRQLAAAVTARGAVVRVDGTDYLWAADDGRFDGWDRPMDNKATIDDFRLDDKEALRKALEAKRFKSVRGEFKFNANHFPVQSYYLRVIGKDGQGRVTNKMMGTIFANHADAYVASCKMK